MSEICALVFRHRFFFFFSFSSLFITCCKNFLLIRDCDFFYYLFPILYPITVAAIICKCYVKTRKYAGHLLILYKVSGVIKMGEKLGECWDAKGV